MSRITSEYTQTYGNFYDYISVIPDSGASVKVEFYTGSQWVDDSQSPLTTPATVFVRNNSLRFTPTGGGAWIGDGQGAQ